MTYLARENQTVAEHLKDVSLLAKKFGETFCKYFVHNY
jgi:hypothetical protein